MIGADSWTVPVLVNGPAKQVALARTVDMASTFRDPESQRLLQSYPDAASWSEAVQSHRMLQDGTQRFTLVELITENCHACAPIGSAISFVDIGPATGGQIVRRPVGIAYDPTLPGMDMEVSPALLKENAAILQFYLNTKGYDAGTMDGIPGPQSRQALMEFQVEHCLPPTGQLDDKAAGLLLSSNGFKAPCAGAHLPAGITANTPLLSGAYVDQPEKCQDPSQVDTVLSLWIITDGSKYQTAGFDNTCVVQRTDMVQGLTKFSAQCTVEGSAWAPTDWTADLQDVDKFTVWYGAPTGKGQPFTRCADDSASAREFFGQPTATQTTPAESAPAALLPRIGDTTDLFNLIGSQLENPCSQSCAVTGTAGRYWLTPFTASALSAQDILATSELHYEQGVPRFQPEGYSEGYPPMDQANKYRLWFVTRTDCEASACPKAIVALLPEAIANYHGDVGYSGPAGRLLDIRPGFRIPPPVAQVAAPAALPQTAPDIRAYCAMQGDAAGPGEEGSQDPEIVAAGGSTWRCMDQKVLVCYLGASGRGCLQTAPPDARQARELDDFCRQNPGSDMIPAYLMTGLATDWTCNGTRAIAVSSSPLDRLGYFVSAWQPLPDAVQPVAAPAATSADDAAQARDLLQALAGRAFEGNVRTHPADAYAPNANYDVQLDVDGQGQAIYRGGIRSPPWRCQGRLTPLSADGDQITLDFARTSGNDDFIVRCPQAGQVSLLVPSPAGPVEFAWLSLGNDNASGSLPLLDSAAYQAQQPPPDVDPCAETAWTGAIPMPVDLFICNQSRAMTMFADGHDMVFPVPASGLRLRDGWYYASYQTRGTLVENTVKSMSVNGMQGWDQWMKVTNAEIYTVTCAFDASSKPDLSPGQRTVKAKLVQFSNGTLLFSCQ